ncbi:hypothetical protein [Mucilaginibacter dorajii]|uniref:Uncharacterized protein n=1 Tax=Mucilaginibacter dorajii TaxID=692994 RepID=A0ABP7QZ28_9SPHI|nr:hypothetical protein [Mucilaginibacter dorajii]MCS3732316.1 hypothetical protein [Mucilaginibacter dorajii]
MKATALFRTGLIVAAFTISFLGINYSSKEMKLAGKKITISTISLGNQAQAYCNEAMYPGEVNNGKCSGQSFEAESRCFIATSGENCTGAHVKP